MVTRSTSYTLRASAPQPLKGECSTLENPAPSTIGFILQTFKAEKQDTDTCEDRSQLLCSNDMVGLGGDFVSASYTAQRLLDPADNSIVFQSTEIRREVISEESEVPGASTLERKGGLIMAKSVTCKRRSIRKPKWCGGRWEYYDEEQIGYTYPPGEQGANIITDEELSKVELISFIPRFSLEKYNELKERLKDERSYGAIIP